MTQSLTLYCCCCVLLPQVVSKSIYLKLKSQADQRARQGWATIKWECVDADNLHKNVHLVQRR
jgi:hypothetical protein